MATTIKLKNGSGAPSASDLVQGEPALDLTNNRLYSENGSGSVVEIGTNPTSLSINGTAVTATAAELNILDGVTSTAAELNILDGVTSTTAELNILDGVTATTAELNILDGVTATAAELNIMDGVTSTAAELNILDGVTSTTAELNILDGVTATAAELNILDGVTSTTAELNILDGVTSSAAELNILDGVTATTAELNILDGVTSTAAELNILDGVTATAAELNVLDGVTAFVDEDDMSSNSATSIPSQQSVKAYVDSQVTAQDLDFQADSGGALSIDLDSETMTFTGGTGIDTSGSGNAVTFAIDSTVATLTGTQTFTNKTLTSPDVNTPDIDGGTIDGTVIGGSTAAAGTFTTFTSTGIDDNATSTAITIDSSERVGIGETAPPERLVVNGSSGDAVELYLDGNTSDSTFDLKWTDNRTGTHAESMKIRSKREGTNGSYHMLFSTTQTGTPAERMRIKSNGNVGIGTQNPDQLLHLKKDDSAPHIRFERNDTSVGNGTSIGQIDFEHQESGNAGTCAKFGVVSGDTDGTGEFLFQTGLAGTTTERLRIDKDGNVGIGTSSPGGLLHLRKDTTDGIAQVLYQNDARQYNVGLNGLLSDSWIIYDNTAAATRFVLDTSGNVGIGSTGNAKLQVFGPSASPSLGTYSNSTAIVSNNAGGYGMSFSVDGSGTGYIQAQNFTSSTAYNLSLNSAGGNVGIGTATVNRKLELSGNNNGGAKANYLRITDTDTTATADNQQGGIEFYASDSSAGAGVTASIEVLYAGSGGGGEITFNTAANSGAGVSEAMRVDESGNLLVAKTSASGTTLGPELLANGQINAASAGDFLNMYSTSASAYRFYVTNAGTINATNTSIQAISDASLKENIRDLDKGLETINALQPRRFDWKNGDGNDIMGFIAQEVQSSLPELVHSTKYNESENKLAIKMGDMIPSMVKAIQELSAQVNELKAEVAALKGA